MANPLQFDIRKRIPPHTDDSVLPPNHQEEEERWMQQVNVMHFLIGDISYHDLYNKPIATAEVSTPNIISNGDFQSNTNWSFGNGWSHDSAQHLADAQNSGGVLSYPHNAMVQSWKTGEYYLVSFDMTRSRGALRVGTGEDPDQHVFRSQSAVKCVIRAFTGADLSFKAINNFTGTVDNVQVQRATPTWFQAMLERVQNEWPTERHQHQDFPAELQEIMIREFTNAFETIRDLDDPADAATLSDLALLAKERRERLRVPLNFNKVIQPFMRLSRHTKYGHCFCFPFLKFNSVLRQDMDDFTATGNAQRMGQYSLADIYSRPHFSQTNIIQNGTFGSNAQRWALSGWTHNTGGFITTSTDAATARQRKPNMVSNGAEWISGAPILVTFHVTRRAGTLSVGTSTRPRQESKLIDVNGTYTILIEADGDAEGLIFTSNHFDGDLDNVEAYPLNDLGKAVRHGKDRRILDA